MSFSLIDTPGSGGGGGDLRFAVAGEDATAGENRSFNLGSNHILSFLGSGTSFFTAEIAGTGSAVASHTVTNGSVQTQAVNSTATGISSMSIDPTAIQFGQTSGKYFFSNIPEYADNAAASGDGLLPGGLYRTGDVLKIVHA
jgi:hypothetical protein